MSDEQFGVSELANRMNMSRSNLLRKVKQETGASVSVFIRRVRLHHARLLLADGSRNASQVSYAVGFNSTSYFTKCFREEYGYTPGEAGAQMSLDKQPAISERNPVPHDWWRPIVIVASIAVLCVMLFLTFRNMEKKKKTAPKSIAVLPFTNNSNDSTNRYFINGLMDAILTHFQKIEDVSVTSRTTMEKYRRGSKTIPEMARELHVNYFVEGSGQKIGDQILLTIRLIDASEDRNIWSRRYNRQLKDVFEIQIEVAKSIASEIDALITPEEQQRIERVPTQNLVAYDYYLKGHELLDTRTEEGLFAAIDQFKKAIAEDGQFVHAYAFIAIAYFYIDWFVAEKRYTEELRSYADKAMLLDKELGESLIARALVYMHLDEYERAVEAFEEVLTYYPNSGWIHNFLTQIYTNYLPNTEKYLTHALQGIRQAVSEEDSVTASYSYLHLSNALAQNGFIQLAENYVMKSLAYNPENHFAAYLHIYIDLAQTFDWSEAKLGLSRILEKDTTRLDVLQELAKVCYSMGQYEESWSYYRAFVRAKKAYNLDIYPGEDIKIGFVLRQLGMVAESDKYYARFLEYAQSSESIYRQLELSVYQASIGNIDQAIDHLREFTKEEGYQYWLVLFMETDPIMLQMADHPKFPETMKLIRDRFWDQHLEIKEMLEEDGII